MTNEEIKLTIDYLKEMQEGYIVGEGYERYPLPEWYALDKAIETIKQTAWIPVSERLPKENGRYWCTVGTDYRNPREMYYEPKGKNNRTWASLDRTYVEDCFVIAWMPLSEPYKGE